MINSVNALVSLVIFFFILLVSPSAVRAELPPFDPAMLQPDPDVPAATELDPIYRGPMEFYTSEFFDTQAFEILAGVEFGFHLEDIILPFYDEKPEQISVPDLEEHSVFAENFQYLLMPQHVTSKSIHWSDINENIQSSLFCARIINQSKYSDEREDITSVGLQESENIPFSQQTFEVWRKLNAATGLGIIEPINGYFDFNLPKELNSIKDARPYCLFTRKSTPLIEKENDVTQLSSWEENANLINGTVWETIYEWVEKFLQDGTSYLVKLLAKFFPKFIVRFTQVGASPSENFALPGDATKEELKNTKQPFLSTLSETRGFAFNFLPEHRSEDPDQKLEENRKWQTEYDFAVFGKTDGSRGAGRNLYGENKSKSTLYPWNIGGNANTRVNQMACTSVPQELIDTGNIVLANVKNAVGIKKFCGPPEQEEEVTTCEEKWFNDLDVDSPDGNSGSHGDPGYSIPYRNTSCTINDSMLDTFIKTAQWWCSSTVCDYGKMSEQLTLERLNQVKEEANKYKWNALYVMALWIHESGLGSSNQEAHHLGCTYGYTASGGPAVQMPPVNDPDDGICSQMACLFAHPNKDPNDDNNFMCSYNTTANVNGVCPSGTDWGFARNIHDIYARLLSCLNTPPGCGFNFDNTGRAFNCTE